MCARMTGALQVLRSIDGGGGARAMPRNNAIVQCDEGVASHGNVTSFMCRL